MIRNTHVAETTVHSLDPALNDDDLTLNVLTVPLVGGKSMIAVTQVTVEVVNNRIKLVRVFGASLSPNAPHFVQCEVLQSGNRLGRNDEHAKLPDWLKQLLKDQHSSAVYDSVDGTVK